MYADVCCYYGERMLSFDNILGFSYTTLLRPASISCNYGFDLQVVIVRFIPLVCFGELAFFFGLYIGIVKGGGKYGVCKW